jgi:hypothetical protein
MDHQPMLAPLLAYAHTRRNCSRDRSHGTRSTAQKRILLPSCDQGMRASIPIADMDHPAECLSADQSPMRRNAMSAGQRQTKSCAFFLPIRAARSRRHRAHAKDCNHCPRHPHSVRPVHENAASVEVSMKPVWNVCMPIIPPQPTKKPCASVRSGLNRYSRDQQ